MFPPAIISNYLHGKEKSYSKAGVMIALFLFSLVQFYN